MVLNLIQLPARDVAHKTIKKITIKIAPPAAQPTPQPKIQAKPVIPQPQATELPKKAEIKKQPQVLEPVIAKPKVTAKPKATEKNQIKPTQKMLKMSQSTAATMPAVKAKMPQPSSQPKPAKNMLITQPKKLKKQTMMQLDKTISSTIQAIAEDMQQAENVTTNGTIFDPRLQQQIQNAQQQLKNYQQYRAKYARQKKYTIIAESGDSVTIRVGDQCLNIPREAAYDPDNLRIISAEMNCPPKDEFKWFE